MDRLIRKIVYLISLLVPVKNRILLESSPDFSDNTYSLYKKMINEGIDKKYEIIWLTKGNIDASKYIGDGKFINVVPKNKVEAIILKIKLFFVFAGSRFIFFTHVIYAIGYAKPNQDVVFLTHGFHFKKGIGRHMIPQKINSLITLSDFDKEIAHEVYGVPKSQMVNIGYPRNDSMKSNQAKSKEFITSIFPNSVKKVLIWMPTLRRHTNGKLNDGGKLDEESDIPLLTSVDDFKKLDSILNEIGVGLIIKPHPAQMIENFTVLESSNIRLIDNDVLVTENLQLYEIIGSVDGLVTDYSSIFIDYLLKDRPIIFTIDDIENYLQTTGFMVKKPLSIMPGHQVKTFDEFVNSLREIAEDIDVFVEKRQKVRDLIFDNYTFESASKVLEHFGLLGE